MPPRRTRTAASKVEQPSLPGIRHGLDLRPHKTLRLAVSGDVALNRIETRLIDTLEFQRLRQIRQLGAAHLVYPTALHTRFDHSLGTLAMTDAMLRAIRANVRVGLAEREISIEQEQLARLFALLHDITHVPFGHTIEDELCIFPRHDRDRRRTERFTGEVSALGKLLSDSLGTDLYHRLLALLSGRAAIDDDWFILDLITNSLCADLLDYLRRDAFFCNIAIDTDYRFLNHLAICRHEGRRRLVIRLWKEGASAPRRDVLNELIRLLDNRYLLGERVYFHHAKLVAGTMLGGAVARSAAAGEIAATDLDELGDDVLLWRLRQSSQPAAARLAGALASRSLWKLVYERGRSLVLAEQQAARQLDVFEDLMGRFHANAAARTAAEDRVAGLLGLDPGDLLIHCPHADMAMKQADVLVFWNGALRPLKECSDDPLIGARLRAILDSHQNLWAIRVFANPARLADRDAAAAACDMLFGHDPSRRRRDEQTHYDAVLRRLAREEKLDRSLTHEQLEAMVKRALGGLLKKNEEARTVETARACLHSALQR